MVAAATKAKTVENCILKRVVRECEGCVRHELEWVGELESELV